jgi:L-amino acid N-acyltransferase YncA
VLIRIATYKDLEEINDIYNQAVEKGQTADLIAIDMESRKKWFEAHEEKTYPVFVAEENNKIIGWLSFSSYRQGRLGLRFTSEISYYIDKNHRRKGVGTKLIEHSLKMASHYHFKTLFAVILENNSPSIMLVEKHGFERWGFMPGVAEIKGEVLGHVYYGSRI